MSLLGLFGLLISGSAVLLAVRRGLLRVGESRWAVATAVATTVFAVLPTQLARLTQDYRLACLILAALAAVLVKLLPVEGPLPAPPPRPRWPWFVLAGLVAFFVSWTALRGHYFDEAWMHYDIASVLARGVVPPEHPLFPGEVFRYHYGFDVLVAEVVAFTHLSVEDAVDVVKILAILELIWVAAAMGATLEGKLAAGLSMVLVPMGSSFLFYFLFRGLGIFEAHLSFIPSAWLDTQVPPAVINFFQHPQGSTMPLALAGLLLFDGTDLDPRRRRARFIVGSVHLGLLSLMHAIFFVMMGGALGVMVLARLLRKRALKEAALDLACLAGALVVALLVGGMIGAGGPKGESVFAWGRYFGTEPLGAAIVHHLTVFGLPLLLFPFAAARAKRQPSDLRVALVAAVLIGFIVPNVVVYRRSWDIVKFLMIGSFFLNPLLADTIAAFVSSLPRKIGWVLLPVLVFLCTSTAWAWFGRTTVFDGRYGMHRWEEPGPPEIGKAFLLKAGPTIAPRERILTSRNDLSKLGFITPGFDYRKVGAESYLLDFNRTDAQFQQAERARKNLNHADLEALEISWLALSPGDVNAMEEAGRAALADSARFERVMEVEAGGEKRTLYRVKR
ncbi:MAG: hypothetical protein U1E65_20870 [Myxococcota bacterium]